MAKTANKPQVTAPAIAEQAPAPQGVGTDETIDKAPALQVDGVRAAERVLVKTLPGVARFCRAELCFGPEPTALVVSKLAEGVLEALLTEPNLVVMRAVQTQLKSDDSPKE